MGKAQKLEKRDILYRFEKDLRRFWKR